MQEYIGKIGGFVVFCAHFPLYVAIVRKTVRPSLATWGMWSVLASAMVASQIAAGKKDVWGMLAAATGTIVVFILLLFYGERKWTAFDTRCLLLSALGVVAWAVSGPATAQIAFLASLFIAGASTVRNAWQNPQNESRLAWGMFALGFGLTVIAITNWHSLTMWVQPVSSTIFNLVVFLLALRCKGKAKA
ncbi:MAG: hypothetical protein Q7S09_02945 [bacterium]|nr:hypothetical protein [bacterium]